MPCSTAESCVGRVFSGACGYGCLSLVTQRFGWSQFAVKSVTACMDNIVCREICGSPV